MKLLLALIPLLFFSACEKNETTTQSSKELLIEKKSFSQLENEIRDLEEFGDSIYALTNKIIYKIDKKSKQEEEILLPQMLQAEGFCLDGEGNIYVADKGANRVIKLLKSKNYALDTSFSINKSGTAKGKLQEPLDVVYSRYHSNDIFYVLDSANKRIQIFNHVGAYLADFKAEGDNMVGSSNLFICDNKDKVIKKVHYNFLTKKTTQEVIFPLDVPTKITLSSDGLVVTQGQKVLYLQVDGSIKKEIQTEQENFMILSYNDKSDLFEVPQKMSRTTNAKKALPSNLHLAPTTQSESAKQLSKNFVTYYLQGNTQALENIASKELLEKLQKSSQQLKELFKQVTKYKEEIYFHNKKAVVTLETVNEKKLLKFYFVWDETRWQLIKVVK